MAEMNRRRFLQSLLAGATLTAGGLIVPETVRRVWQVGAKLERPLVLADRYAKPVHLSSSHGYAYDSDATIFLPPNAYASLVCELRGVENTADNRRSILDALPKEKEG
jgi:hypothetical protein